VGIVTDQVKRIGFFIAALVCFGLGLLSLPLPLPLGIVFNLLGVALLVMSSTKVRGWFHNLRRRNKWIDERVSDVENHLPDDMRDALTPDPKTGQTVDLGSDQNSNHV